MENVSVLNIQKRDIYFPQYQESFVRFGFFYRRSKIIFQLICIKFMTVGLSQADTIIIKRLIRSINVDRYN